VAIVRGEAATANYLGNGICYLEFGNDEVARVNVTFTAGQAPSGTYDAPSAALTAQKSEFGSSRARRWFGREWTALGD
jgi:sulfide:quinone oxidoreductase